MAEASSNSNVCRLPGVRQACLGDQPSQPAAVRLLRTHVHPLLYHQRVVRGLRLRRASGHACRPCAPAMHAAARVLEVVLLVDCLALDGVVGCVVCNDNCRGVNQVVVYTNNSCCKRMRGRQLPEERQSAIEATTYSKHRYTQGDTQRPRKSVHKPNVVHESNRTKTLVVFDDIFHGTLCY